VDGFEPSTVGDVDEKDGDNNDDAEDDEVKDGDDNDDGDEDAATDADDDTFAVRVVSGFISCSEVESVDAVLLPSVDDDGDVDVCEVGVIDTVVVVV
jgi:hypothetical protein